MGQSIVDSRTTEGLGFAGGPHDAMGELPTVGIAAAIIAFSIGVELGHQVVVLPVYAAMRHGDRMSPDVFRRTTLRYGSVIISLLGAYYLFHAVTAA